MRTSSLSLVWTTVPIVPEVRQKASYGYPDGFDSQARWRQRRTRDRALELQRQRRTDGFHLPHTGESQTCHRTRARGASALVTATWLEPKQWDNIASCHLQIFRAALALWLSHPCGCGEWCEPEERFFLRRWHATAGGDNVKFTRNDRLLPTRGAQMKGNGCLLMAAAVLATAPWPGRGEWVKHRQRQSRTPPGTASSSPPLPPLSTPHRLSSTVSACVSTTTNNVL